MRLVVILLSFNLYCADCTIFAKGFLTEVEKSFTITVKGYLEALAERGIKHNFTSGAYWHVNINLSDIIVDTPYAVEEMTLGKALGYVDFNKRKAYLAAISMVIVNSQYNDRSNFRLYQSLGDRVFLLVRNGQALKLEWR